MIACMFCSFFVQAGEGAVYAVVPLVKKRVSGQISGMAGAFGNVGAVTFLTIGLYVSERVFFLVIAGAAVVAFIANLFGSSTSEAVRLLATSQWYGRKRVPRRRSWFGAQATTDTPCRLVS